MKRTDVLALFIAVLTLASSLLVTQRVFEETPYIEDEMAYVWQAQVLARL